MKQFLASLIVLLLMNSLASAQSDYYPAEIVWSPDGERFALLLSRLNDSESLIKIYNAETLELEQTLYNTGSQAFHLAWSPDSQRIVTNDYGNNASIRALDGTLLASFNSSVKGIVDDEVVVENSAWNYDGSLLAEINHRSVIIRDGQTGNNALPLDPEENDPVFLSFIWNESANILAVSTFDKRILLVDPLNQAVVAEIFTSDFVFFHSWRGNRLYVQAVYLSDFSDSQTFRQMFQILDSETGELIDEYDMGDMDSIYDSQFSMDASVLLIRRPDNSVQIWDVATWDNVRSMDYPITSALAISPDNSKLLVVNTADDMTYIDLGGDS